MPRTRNRCTTKQLPLCNESLHKRSPTRKRFSAKVDIKFEDLSGRSINNCCTITNSTTIKQLKQQISQNSGIPEREVMILSNKTGEPLPDTQKHLIKIKNTLKLFVDDSCTPTNLSDPDALELRVVLDVLLSHPYGLSIDKIAEDDNIVDVWYDGAYTEDIAEDIDELIGNLEEDGVVTHFYDKDHIRLILLETGWPTLERIAVLSDSNLDAFISDHEAYLQRIQDPSDQLGRYGDDAFFKLGEQLYNRRMLPDLRSYVINTENPYILRRLEELLQE